MPGEGQEIVIIPQEVEEEKIVCLDHIKKENYLEPMHGGIECAKTFEGEHGGQCVAFIQKVFGYHEDFRGYARDLEPNTTEPKEGTVVLHGEHAAIIYDIEGDELLLLESNYESGKEEIAMGRKMKVTDPRIRGYFDHGKMLE